MEQGMDVDQVEWLNLGIAGWRAYLASWNWVYAVRDGKTMPEAQGATLAVVRTQVLWIKHLERPGTEDGS